MWKLYFTFPWQTKHVECFLNNMDDAGYYPVKRILGCLYSFAEKKISAKPARYAVIYNPPGRFPMTAEKSELKSEKYLAKEIISGGITTPSIHSATKECDFAEIKYSHDYKLARCFKVNLLVVSVMIAVFLPLFLIGYFSGVYTDIVLATVLFSVISAIALALLAYYAVGYRVLKMRRYKPEYYLDTEEKEPPTPILLERCKFNSYIQPKKAERVIAVKESPDEKSSFPDSGWRLVSEGSARNKKTEIEKLESMLLKTRSVKNRVAPIIIIGASFPVTM